ncbi:hypothetical protein [Qipengyuania atrilutea]|uniref:Uncharacterized protein n=1 Tax=Qipengyuania atrilutea TaxID=2744473 RepID=A0A850HBJ1_9SPHN|nr:hypothetical protein [Actirhodobacter atriluteus]NVD44439.1 hypothetical protein [Actirhodobacter atriluteus]
MPVCHTPIRLLAIFAAVPLLQGCIAKTALDVVTAPVKVVGKAADWATESQDEADRNRGREIRKREEELGKLEREYDKQMRRCDDGNSRACSEAREIYAEMQLIIPTIPYEPR